MVADFQDDTDRQEIAGSSGHSTWVTLAIFTVIAHFNPEILTGSTRVEQYLSPVTLFGMLFYGLQVAIIADLAARYRFKWRTIYLVGLIYGIFEEGFAVETMLSPHPPGFVDVLRIAGLNVTWSIYIAIFHAVVSVLCSILIIRLIWPDRISRPFLHRRHYLIVVPSLVIIYVIFIRFVTLSYVPETSAIVVLLVSCFVVGLLARSSQSREVRSPGKSPTTRNYMTWGVLLCVGSFILPFVFGQLPLLTVPTTLLLLAVGFLFSGYFREMDRDPGLTRRKELAVFALFVGFWLVFGTAFRTSLSSIVAYLGVGLQVYFGWRRSSFSSEAPIREPGQ